MSANWILEVRWTGGWWLWRAVQNDSDAEPYESDIQYASRRGATSAARRWLRARLEDESFDRRFDWQMVGGSGDR